VFDSVPLAPGPNTFQASDSGPFGQSAAETLTVTRTLLSAAPLTAQQRMAPSA
jgi:hypothetical protein